MPRPGGADMRAAPRVPVALELRLARSHGRPVTARTVDLGAGGARVVCDRPLRVDEELRFDVDLPAGCHCDGTARVLRHDLHNVYALRFERCPAATVEELRAFVDATLH